MRKEFPKKVKLAAWERCKREDGQGYCEGCGQPIKGRPEYDHILPCGLGGLNDLDNCQVLCRRCHHDKTFGAMEKRSNGDLATIAKADRIREKHLGIRKSKYRWGKRKFGDGK